jgi:hypothetical protein
VRDELDIAWSKFRFLLGGKSLIETPPLNLSTPLPPDRLLMLLEETDGLAGSGGF